MTRAADQQLDLMLLFIAETAPQNIVFHCRLLITTYRHRCHSTRGWPLPGQPATPRGASVPVTCQKAWVRESSVPIRGVPPQRARGYRQHVATSPGRGWPVLLTGFAALMFGTAACSGHSIASHHAASPGQPPPAPVTERAAHGRFKVLLSGKALQEAKAAGFSLPALTDRALDRIDALLPGPKTTIAVNYARPDKLIPQAGANGFTDPVTGHITVAFGSTPQTSIGKALTLWLPRALSHEVDHSVRVLAGPGFGSTLLPQIISEGISSVFDEAAFPGPSNPWDDAISQSQQCDLWKKAKSQLGYTGLYDLWMFGGYGVPHWTGFTIGYHIVKDYRSRHPHVSWAALTAASATAILAGSHYQPCP
jgi:hypothetical protein